MAGTRHSTLSNFEHHPARDDSSQYNDTGLVISASWSPHRSRVATSLPRQHSLSSLVDEQQSLTGTSHNSLANFERLRTRDDGYYHNDTGIIISASFSLPRSRVATSWPRRHSLSSLVDEQQRPAGTTHHTPSIPDLPQTPDDGYNHNQRDLGLASPSSISPRHLRAAASLRRHYSSSSHVDQDPFAAGATNIPPLFLTPFSLSFLQSPDNTYEHNAKVVISWLKGIIVPVSAFSDDSSSSAYSTSSSQSADGSPRLRTTSVDAPPDGALDIDNEDVLDSLLPLHDDGADEDSESLVSLSSSGSPSSVYGFNGPAAEAWLTSPGAGNSMPGSTRQGRRLAWPVLPGRRPATPFYHGPSLVAPRAASGSLSRSAEASSAYRYGMVASEPWLVEAEASFAVPSSGLHRGNTASPIRAFQDPLPAEQSSSNYSSEDESSESTSLQQVPRAALEQSNLPAREGLLIAAPRPIRPFALPDPKEFASHAKERRPFTPSWQMDTPESGNPTPLARLKRPLPKPGKIRPDRLVKVYRNGSPLRIGNGMVGAMSDMCNRIDGKVLVNTRIRLRTPESPMTGFRRPDVSRPPPVCKLPAVYSGASTKDDLHRASQHLFSPAPSPQPKTRFIVAIAGVSSSGKTVLSHLLAHLFDVQHTLRQDDFFRPSDACPRVTLVAPAGMQTEVANMHCEEAIDWGTFASTLTLLMEQSKLSMDPAGRDLSAAGKPEESLTKIRKVILDELERRVRGVLRKKNVEIALVEGPLLFAPLATGHPDASVAVYDRTLWLTTSRAVARRRWLDRHVSTGGRRPGEYGDYFDQVVWRQFRESAAWVGQMGAEFGVRPRYPDLGVEDSLRWAVGEVLGLVESA